MTAAGARKRTDPFRDPDPRVAALLKVASRLEGDRPERRDLDDGTTAFAEGLELAISRLHYHVHEVRTATAQHDESGSLPEPTFFTSDPCPVWSIQPYGSVRVCRRADGVVEVVAGTVHGRDGEEALSAAVRAARVYGDVVAAADQAPATDGGAS